MKPYISKRPKHGARISFARIADLEYVAWRLYRRSEIDRRLFVEEKSFSAWERRSNIAAYLRQMRRRLRNEVGAYDALRAGSRIWGAS